jgi:hypothetical protein
MGKKENQAKYYAANKERIDLEKRKWLVNNPEARKLSVKKYKEANKEKAQQYIVDNYEWHIWSRVSTRCKRSKVEFNLEVSDIIIPDMCPYLGIKLTRIQGQGRQDTNPSIDRIDPSKGYIKGNIEVISDLANRMKNNATKEQLIVFAYSVLEKYDGRVGV